MKKILFLGFCFVFLLAMLVFFAMNKQSQKRELIKELAPLACDLSIKACEYEFKGQKVEVEFKEKPLQTLIENELIIKNLGDFKDLNARIYGLNMYMGDVVPHFERVGENSYKASVVPSACVLDTMRFRVEFFEGKKSIDFYFDFDIKR